MPWNILDRSQTKGLQAYRANQLRVELSLRQWHALQETELFSSPNIPKHPSQTENCLLRPSYKPLHPLEAFEPFHLKRKVNQAIDEVRQKEVFYLPACRDYKLTAAPSSSRVTIRDFHTLALIYLESVRKHLDFSYAASNWSLLRIDHP